ncbi:histone deacetylase, putative [Babesia bigemina]|uniref:Histone deacetylase, putative n=1 Tax=Babesia bigemina TaxID=5866 RepID=A0A061DBJ7_BABBI|nr:histone deacetylase, putative [Babesia bigemina]CDR98086.1 histone deacetylase, putative [Babesia bigemina]|eukprot:XP_012770272.1 histone deacetylase, putative [Babesia bigemina]
MIPIEMDLGYRLMADENEDVPIFRAEIKPLIPERRATPGIHKCVMKNDFDALKRILASRRRESINDCDHFGRTPLHIAMQMANPKALYLLLYYPLVHHSKVFATQDWDHLLGHLGDRQSDDWDVDIAMGLDEKCDKMELDDSLHDTNTESTGPQSTRLAKDTGVDKFKAPSSGIRRKKVEWSQNEQCSNVNGTKIDGSWKMDTRLLRHWEDSPSSYNKSVFGFDRGSTIFGCGTKEVEALYEEHYKFLVGEPHNLEVAARNYSAIYAGLYASHPANLSHVMASMGEGVPNIHTTITFERSHANDRKSVAVTTHLADSYPCGAPDDVEQNDDAQEMKEHNTERSTGKGVDNRDSNAITGYSNSAQHSHSSLRPHLRDMVNATLTRRDCLPVPLATTDLLFTYDKTSPIHLLFSNIYIESYRNNIIKCFRILLHYFGKFSESTEGSGSHEGSLGEASSEENEVSETPIVPGTPTASSTELAAIERNTPQKHPENSEPSTHKRLNLTSCGVPSSSRNAFNGADTDEAVENHFKKAKTCKDTNSGSRGDGSTRNTVRMDTGESDGAVGNLIGKSQLSAVPTVTDTSKRVEYTKTAHATEYESSQWDSVDAVVTIDAVSECAVPLNEQKENLVPCSGNPTPIRDLVNRPNVTPNNFKGHPGINQTLCADVSEVDVDAMASTFKGIGDIRRGRRMIRHKNCSQIAVKPSEFPLVSKYVLGGHMDYKMQALNDIVCSSSLLTPTMPWETFLNQRDYTRSNLLHKVCQIRDADLIKWLIGCGCMPLVVNEVGDLPVHLAMDAKDPLCLVTMLHETLKALFYHKRYMTESKRNNEEGAHFLQDDQRNLCRRGLSFESFMKSIKFYKRSEGCETSVVVEAAQATSIMRASVDEKCHPRSEAPHVPINEASLLCTGEYGLLRDVEYFAIFEEMMKLIEQLTYRGIKAGAWEAIVAMYSYNEGLTFHVLASPQYMHRFIKLSIMIGNSKHFMDVASFIATTLVKADATESSVKSLESGYSTHGKTLNNVENVCNGAEAVGKVEVVPRSQKHVQSTNTTAVGRYKGCAFPSLSLKRAINSITMSVTDDPALYVTCPEATVTRRDVDSLLQNFRGHVPNQDTIADNKYTWVITHPTCLHHLALPEPTDAPNRRHRLIMSYPENPTRLEVIITNENGILRSDTLEHIKLLHSPPPATLADILRVHDWGYIDKLLNQVQTAQKRWMGNNYWPVLADGDTPATPHSWNSAMYAAGSVIAAVDAVCNGHCRNAFCAVRPPGHHLGTWGGAQSADFEDEDFAAGSQGFCLINNVAVGAAYAKYMYAKKGIRKIAIIDFDIHHGNGTHQIVLNIGPRNVRCRHGNNGVGNDSKASQYNHPHWFGWRDAHDREEVFFSSIHAYDGVFYPGTGRTCSKYKSSEPRIINVGIPEGTTSAEFKILFEGKILPYLLHFQPDLIFISAGFDGHYRDSVSSGFVRYNEKDFYWATERLVAVANTVCSGRVVSVLEGGYNTRLDTLSPFAKSVFEHVKALSNTHEGFVYPFMHSHRTVDMLLLPMLDDKSITPPQLTKSDADNLSIQRAMSKSAFITKATDQLLRKAYGMPRIKCTNGPPLFMTTPTHIMGLEAVAQTGNAFYSFYSKHFHSLFMADTYLGSREYVLSVLHNIPAIGHDVFTFDKCLGIRPLGNNAGGSLFSYSDESVTMSKIASAFIMQVANAGNDGRMDQRFTSNAWAMGIKMKSLERHATAAALLCGFFQKFEYLFKCECKLH